AGKKVSIERDVFPKLASKGELYYYPIPGIWKDIGKPEELLEGNIEFMLETLHSLKGSKKNLISDTLDIEGKALIYPPVAIGENVTIRKQCEIGPNVIIGDNVYIGENTKIKETLIYNKTYISSNVYIEKAIISDNCLIQNDVELKGKDQNLIILASYVQVLKNVKISAPVNSSMTVCHHETVSPDLGKFKFQNGA
ncbi:MAG: hypothetical protein ACFFE4_19470, partial [Candidatus Thorarchaeota archaeon]